jgi:hypothetical protein
VVLSNSSLVLGLVAAFLSYYLVIIQKCMRVTTHVSPILPQASCLFHLPGVMHYTLLAFSLLWDFFAYPSILLLFQKFGETRGAQTNFAVGAMPHIIGLVQPILSFHSKRGSCVSLVAIQLHRHTSVPADMHEVTVHVRPSRYHRRPPREGCNSLFSNDSHSQLSSRDNT